MKILAAAFTLAWFAATAFAEPRNVSAELERIRDKHELPALAAAAVVEGEIVAIGATGRRNADSPERVLLEDQWQLASITKSMTASVAAMLVEEGKLAWNIAIGNLFPEIPMNEAWRDVTLDQLLMHRGGAPHEPPKELWKAACLQEGTPSEQRLALMRGVLADEPEKPPGTHFIYSDVGYTIVGMMMERAAGKPWEELMRERLFLPLGMLSAGFGPSATPGKIDQPWGHQGEEAPFKPFPPGPDADSPPAIAPAAAVHCTIRDFARYVAWHVAGERGDGWLLEQETFKTLHRAPEGQNYAMGFVNLRRRWAGGTALMHNGENTMAYAVMWLGPGADTAFVATSNADGYNAQDACDEAIRHLINEF